MNKPVEVCDDIAMKVLDYLLRKLSAYFFYFFDFLSAYTRLYFLGEDVCLHLIVVL